jgi:hypothetical protein
MDDFKYAIASILGAMLVVVSLDLYIFLQAVANR